jgi:hypothetical protein
MSGGPAAYGTYTIDVTADGAARSCTLVLTAEAFSGGRLVSGDCSSGVEVLVGPSLKCDAAKDGAPAETNDSTSCPLVEFITLAASPASVHVTQSLGGVVVLDQTVMPAYQVAQPNGPDCAPTCRVGGASWTIP